MPVSCPRHWARARARRVRDHGLPNPAPAPPVRQALRPSVGLGSRAQPRAQLGPWMRYGVSHPGGVGETECWCMQPTRTRQHLGRKHLPMARLRVNPIWCLDVPIYKDVFRHTSAL